ncbi:hypothetical protein D918_05917 [Trichuris suis]|nr:hypothetical protein D918_05917 [Trichuris suis]
MAYLRLRAGTRSNFADQESPFERIADWLRKEAQSATGRRSSPLGTLAFLNITDSQKTKVLIEEVKRKIEVVQQQLRRADPASSSATYRLSEEPVQNTSRKTARLSSRAFDFNDANEPIEPELSQSKITSTNDSVSKAKSMTQPEKEAIAVLVTSADEKSQSRQMNAHMSRNASMEAEKTISAYYDTQESDRNGVHDCSTRSRRVSEEQSRKTSYAVDNGGTKSEDLPEMQSSSSASPPTCSYDVNDHTSAHMPFELASVSKNRRKSEIELTKARVSRDSSTRKSVTKVSSTQKRGNENRKRTTNAHLHTFSEITKLTAQAGSPPLASSSRLRSPEISWGNAREKTPGRRRSSRTRVPRLRPELGEVIKYEYVDGGLRQIVGVVPGYVDHPTLKRNKVHTMSQYVDLLCKKRLDRRNVQRKTCKKGTRQVNRMGAGELHPVAPDGDVLTERRPFHFTCQEMADGVVKYEHDEVTAIALLNIRRGAEFRLNVERNQTFCVAKGAIMITLNGSHMNLSARDFVILRAGDALTAKNNSRKKAIILTCLR